MKAYFGFSYRVSFLLVIGMLSSALPQWQQTAGPYNGFITKTAIIGTNLFAATYGKGVLRSTNNGASWTSVNDGLSTNLFFIYDVIGCSLR